MKSTLRSHRLLLTNLLALVIAISALVWVSPASAQEPICESGCVAWDIQNGCTRWMHCCVWGPDDWICIETGPVN